MITKEKIIEILHSHSYNVEDQAGNHLIVVDDDSWDEIAEQLKNCSIPNVVGQSEQFVCNCQGCGEEKKIEYCEKCYAENLPNISN